MIDGEIEEIEILKMLDVGNNWKKNTFGNYFSAGMKAINMIEIMEIEIEKGRGDRNVVNAECWK